MATHRRLVVSFSGRLGGRTFDQSIFWGSPVCQTHPRRTNSGVCGAFPLVVCRRRDPFLQASNCGRAAGRRADHLQSFAHCRKGPRLWVSVGCLGHLNSSARKLLFVVGHDFIFNPYLDSSWWCVLYIHFQAFQSGFRRARNLTSLPSSPKKIQGGQLSTLTTPTTHPHHKILHDKVSHLFRSSKIPTPTSSSLRRLSTTLHPIAVSGCIATSRPSHLLPGKPSAVTIIPRVLSQSILRYSTVRPFGSRRSSLVSQALSEPSADRQVSLPYRHSISARGKLFT